MSLHPNATYARSVLQAPTGDPVWIYACHGDTEQPLLTETLYPDGSPVTLPTLTSGDNDYLPCRVRAWMTADGVKHMVVWGVPFTYPWPAGVYAKIFYMANPGTGWGTPTEIVSQGGSPAIVRIAPADDVLLFYCPSTGGTGGVIQQRSLTWDGSAYAVGSAAPLTYGTSAVQIEATLGLGPALLDSQGRIEMLQSYSGFSGRVMFSTSLEGLTWQWQATALMAGMPARGGMVRLLPSNDLISAWVVDTVSYQVRVLNQQRGALTTPTYTQRSLTDLALTARNVGDLWLDADGTVRMVYTDMDYATQVMSSDLAGVTWA